MIEKKIAEKFNLSMRVMQISDPIFLLIYFFATSVSDRRYLFSCHGTVIKIWEKLEIKPCGFESTIRDMEAERYKDK